MRHYKKGRKLGTSKAHTKAMKRSLVAALFENDRIKTIEARAKEIRPDVDKIITWAKKGDLHSRRLAIAALGGNKELVREVFEKVEQGMFKDRKGGYTRIMKLGYRKGDNAPIVIMELVSERVSKKKSSGASSASKAATSKTTKSANGGKTAAKSAKDADKAAGASASQEPDEIVVEGEEVLEENTSEDVKGETEVSGADGDAKDAEDVKEGESEDSKAGEEEASKEDEAADKEDGAAGEDESADKEDGADKDKSADGEDK